MRQTANLSLAMTVVASLVVASVVSVALAAGPNQYKRVHQNALNQITAGKIEAAVKSLSNFAAEYPDDAETQFMLAVANAQLGKVDEAVSNMKKAIKLGLPPGRFVAGPRDLLAPIAERPEFKRLAAEAAGEPIHGPYVGSVTDASARFWVRTATPIGVHVVVSESKDLVSPKTAAARSSAETDFTAVVEVTGLKPDTLYYYAVLLDKKAAAADKTRQQFRTSPSPGTPLKFTLAFGGGAGFVPQHEHIWRTIDSFKPRLMLLLGDNIYSDNPQSPHMQRYSYYRRQSRPEFRDLMARTPVYSIWDDHDFGTNDCWGGPEIDVPKWKRPVWNLFKENWVNPGYGGGEKTPGVYYTFSVGDVEFFMLDGRYYRTSPNVENPSMLGPVQRAWLKEKLAASKATFKVILSPVPWDYRAKGPSLDTWNGFHAERDDVFATIDKHRLNGVLLMSADRHRSDAWRIERESGYDLYEFNSSRLTNQHVHGTMKEAIFSYNAKQSFGLVTFDTTGDDPTVKYEVVNIDGEVVHTLRLKLSQLSYK